MVLAHAAPALTLNALSPEAGGEPDSPSVFALRRLTRFENSLIVVDIADLEGFIMKQYWMIWAVFVIATLHYPAIALFAFPSGANADAGLMFTYVLALMGLVSGMASLFVWSRLVKEPFREGKLKIDLDSDQPKLHPMVVIAWALAEAPAVFGICAAVIEPAAYASIGFAAWSLIIFLLETPAFLNERA